MRELSERLRDVRVCCGDWSRICGPSPTVKHGITGVFLDPPYAEGRTEGLYASDSFSVSVAIREWAIEWGEDPRMRIALCGYEGEHQMPDSWECVHWKARGGYGSQGDEDGLGRNNSGRERIWFSPNCLTVTLDFERPKRELAELSALRESGHPDQDGIERAMGDWIMEDAMNEADRRKPP